MIVAFLCVWFPTQVQAQYTVQPMVVDHTLDARDQVRSPITIQNTSDRVMRLYATVNAVKLDAAGGIESFTSRNQSDNKETVTSWLSVDRGRIEIPPGATHETSVHIQVHPNAVPGTYHAFVGFADGRNRSAAEEKVANGQAPGTIVRIEVAENRTSYLRLDRFFTERFITDPANSQLVYHVENPGDTPLVPSGELIIYDARGREVGAVPVNEARVEIQPGETQEFTSPVPESNKIGRYRAYLTLNYGQGQLASLQDTIFFFQIPLASLIIIFVVLLLVAMGVAYMLHRRYVAPSGIDHDEIMVFHRPNQQSQKMEHDIDLTRKSAKEDHDTRS